MNLSDVVGIIGVISCLVAYAGLQLGRLRQDDLRYIGLNILSPVCLLFSLLHDFNLAAVITQVLWLCLTVFGLANFMRARRQEMRRTARISMGNEGLAPVTTIAGARCDTAVKVPAVRETESSPTQRRA